MDAVSKACVIEQNPGHLQQKPVLLLCLEMIEDNIWTSIKQGNARLKLIFMFAHQIVTVPLQLLDLFLAKLEMMLKETPRWVQERLCENIFSTIVNNFDYSRKNQLIQWYLKQLENLNLLQEQTQIKFSSIPPSSL